MSYAELKGFKKKYGFVDSMGGGGTPQNCTALKIVYDTDNNQATMKWKNPKNTYVENQLITTWKETKLVRKKDSYPVNQEDGDVLVTSTTRNEYYTEGYTDTTIPAGDDVNDYFYALFPSSDTGATSCNEDNRFRKCIIYGYIRTKSEGSTFARIAYTDDCEGFTPAQMDFAEGVFNLGRWNDSFVIESFRPCMLREDGTVDHYMSREDQNFKEDGVTPSDVANSSFVGNAMVEEERKYFFRYEDEYFEVFKVSNVQVNESYTSYGFKNWAGEDVNYRYRPMFNGTLISNKLRSIGDSSLTIISGQTAPNEINYAIANNTADDIANKNFRWFTECATDWFDLQDLLILIGKNDNTQAVFGAGWEGQSGANAVSYCKKPGTLLDKGMFWGSNVSGGSGAAVKVFYMENPWGNQWRRLAGLVNLSNILYMKPSAPYYYSATAGNYANAASYTGAGYVNTGVTLSGTSGGYCKETEMKPYGRMPKVMTGGSATTYTADGVYFSSGVMYAFAGGHVNYSAGVSGASCLSVYNTAASAVWAVGASVSYR